VRGDAYLGGAGEGFKHHLHGLLVRRVLVQRPVQGQLPVHVGALQALRVQLRQQLQRVQADLRSGIQEETAGVNSSETDAQSTTVDKDCAIHWQTVFHATQQ
jgi:hypothetical protein